MNMDSLATNLAKRFKIIASQARKRRDEGLACSAQVKLRPLWRADSQPALLQKHSTRHIKLPLEWRSQKAALNIQ